jgi:hypothetical protein
MPRPSHDRVSLGHQLLCPALFLNTTSLSSVSGLPCRNRHTASFGNSMPGTLLSSLGFGLALGCSLNDLADMSKLGTGSLGGSDQCPNMSRMVLLSAPFRTRERAFRGTYASETTWQTNRLPIAILEFPHRLNVSAVTKFVDSFCVQPLCRCLGFCSLLRHPAWMQRIRAHS